MREMQTSVAAILIVLAGIGLAACRGGNDEPATATMTPTVTQNPTSTATEPPATPTPSLEEEVLDAYRRYWEVYGEALFELNGGPLESVMTGPRLERALEELESLRADGQAVESVLQLDPVVASVDGEQATVIDEYENGSYLIDPETKEAVSGHGTPIVIREAFTLVRIEGVWKVLDSVRQAGPES